MTTCLEDIMCKLITMKGCGHSTLVLSAAVTADTHGSVTINKKQLQHLGTSSLIAEQHVVAEMLSEMMYEQDADFTIG